MAEQIDIPGYTMVGKIAEGGMASVWKARQDKLDRVVAVKVLLKRADSDQQEFERFIYEARAAASLVHPNIVQVIDAGEGQGFLYYIMEYVPGPTAGTVVDEKGAMPEARVLNIGAEVAEALDYAWRDHRVVHCDIKPDNLLLHRNGRTKIADLGLAQVLGQEAVAIEEGMTLGTPNYFPPEQALVEEGLDCRADMYALAATLYHLGTGQIPFGELAPEEVASQQVHGQMPNPRELNPSLSAGFCCLIERMMAKDPSNRYANWGEVLADIQLVKEGHLVRKPLPAHVPSTVAHTELKSGKDGVIIRGDTTGRGVGRHRVRRRGAPRRGPVRSPGGPVQVERAAAVAARRKPARTPGNIWPLVLALGLVALGLYGWTLIRIQAGL